METGIYEQLITNLLEKELIKLEASYYIEKQEINSLEAAIYLSGYLSQILRVALETYSLNDKNRIQKQIELSNSLIQWLAETLPETGLSENLLVTKGEILKALYSSNNPIAKDLKTHITQITPFTGLTQSELFTGSNTRLSLESELRREIQSSDEIWWLVSFIKWTGIRIFTEELKQFARNGKNNNYLLHGCDRSKSCRFHIKAS